MEEKRIVIVGAGFGGITAAITLARDPAVAAHGYEIVLVDRHAHHLYTAGLYEVAAVPRTAAPDERLAASLSIPVADIIRGRPIRFVRDTLAGLDAGRRRIMLASGGTLPYAFLILALGAETNYFNIPGLTRYGVPLKTADDAVLLRNAIEQRTRERPSLTIIVGGAGATGVELAAELINFLCVLERQKNPAAPACRTTVMLLEASPRILPGFNRHAVACAEKRLHGLGVMVKTGQPLIAASEYDITLKNGERLPYDILVWTGGIRGPQAAPALGLPLSPKGAFVVDAALRAGHPDARIFAIGDNAAFPQRAGTAPLPATAQVAEAQGQWAAKNISRAIRGKRVRRFRPLKKYPFVLAIGRKYAFADLAGLRVPGIFGWCIKQLVQLRYFLFILPWRRAAVLWWRNMRLYHAND